jgi:hypothetical protein
MLKALKKFWFVPFVSVFMISLNLVLTLLGFFVVPLFTFLDAGYYTQSIAYPRYFIRIFGTFRGLWLWENEEDGIDGLPLLIDDSKAVKNYNWYVQTMDWSQFRRIFVWSAWRNSANNFRFTRLGTSPTYPVDNADVIGAWVCGAKFWLRWISPSCNWGIKLGWQPGFGGGWKATIDRPEEAGA